VVEIKFCHTSPLCKNLFGCPLKIHYWPLQARNQLGTSGEAKSFLRGAKFFKLCPIFLNYVQHIFPGGRIIF